MNFLIYREIVLAEIAHNSTTHRDYMLANQLYRAIQDRIELLSQTHMINDVIASILLFEFNIFFRENQDLMKARLLQMVNFQLQYNKKKPNRGIFYRPVINNIKEEWIQSYSERWKFTKSTIIPVNDITRIVIAFDTTRNEDINYSCKVSTFDKKKSEIRELFDNETRIMKRLETSTSSMQISPMVYNTFECNSFDDNTITERFVILERFDFSLRQYIHFLYRHLVNRKYTYEQVQKIHQMFQIKLIEKAKALIKLGLYHYQLNTTSVVIKGKF